MSQADSDNSTAAPAADANNPLGAPASPADAFYIPTDISPEELFHEIGRIRSEAQDAIEKLIDLLDRTEGFVPTPIEYLDRFSDRYADEREPDDDEEPLHGWTNSRQSSATEHADQDGAEPELANTAAEDSDPRKQGTTGHLDLLSDGGEPALGFLEQHPTVWGGARDRSGNQERLCEGLGNDLEDQHDGREPNVDDEPSIGYDVEPPEEDTGDAEPWLGWTEAFAQGSRHAGPPTDYEESPTVVTSEAQASYKRSKGHPATGVTIEHRYSRASRYLTGLSETQRAAMRKKAKRGSVSSLY
jgi:hypothetical protein